MASKFSECTCRFYIVTTCLSSAGMAGKMLAKLSISYCTVSYSPFSPRMMILLLQSLSSMRTTKSTGESDPCTWSLDYVASEPRPPPFYACTCAQNNCAWVIPLKKRETVSLPNMHGEYSGKVPQLVVGLLCRNANREVIAIIDCTE